MASVLTRGLNLGCGTASERPGSLNYSKTSKVTNACAVGEGDLAGSYLVLLAESPISFTFPLTVASSFFIWSFS